MPCSRKLLYCLAISLRNRPPAVDEGAFYKCAACWSPIVVLENACAWIQGERRKVHLVYRQNLGTRGRGPRQFLLVEMDVLTGKNNSPKRMHKRKGLIQRKGRKETNYCSSAHGEKAESAISRCSFCFCHPFPWKLSQSETSPESGSQS